MKKRLSALFLTMAMALCCLTGCGGETAKTPEEGKFTPGTYEGVGKGNNGEVKVSVTFSADAITDIKITDHQETPGLSDPAIERIPAAIKDNQSLAVDAVSGATNTSKAILEAVTACVTAAGADPSDFMTPVEKEGQTTIDETCDVLIIGAGGAGLTAALSALQNGAKDVIVIEKQATFGNATAVAGGLAGGCSELQKSFGITEDSPEQIYADIMKGGENANQEDLVKVWSENMGSTLDWLIANGVPITQQFSNFPEHTYQRSYQVDGGSSVMLTVLAEDIKKAGGQIHMETKAESLITENGAVTGVVASTASGTVNYHAGKVILASGGFGANPEMLSDDLSVALFYGAASSTGEGIRMAEDAGAQLCFMDYAKMYPTGIQVEENYARVATVHTALTTQTTGAILVNKEGKRVLNENLDFVSIKNATKEQTDHILFLVMDQAAYDVWSKSANDSSSPSGRFTYEEQENWFNSDAAFPIFSRSTDLKEAAQKAGIDGDALVTTVKEWNAAVKAGKDSLGREQLLPLAEDGTYYIIEEKLRFATTLGGVKINDGFEVLDANNQPIPGFYAAGECVGGAHGHESMPTCMLSWAVTSGKLCGAIVAGK